MVFHGQNEADVENIMQYPFTMVASDSGIRLFGSGIPHPRGYGSNARVLAEYVREKKLIRLEDAIRKMTSLPAQKFHLTGRGLLQASEAEGDVAVPRAGTDVHARVRSAVAEITSRLWSDLPVEDLHTTGRTLTVILERANAHYGTA